MTAFSLRQFFPFLLKIRFPRLPVTVEFTREGLIFILLSLAIGAAAVNTGNNILYLIFSLMLGLIVVSGIFSRRILKGLSAKIEFPSFIFSETAVLSYVTVENRKKKLPSIGVQLVLRDSAFPKAARYFFYVPPRSKHNTFMSITFPKRGIYYLRELELRTRFPFSFFIKIHRMTVHTTVRVYPVMYRISDEVLARYTEGLLQESPYRGDSAQILHLRDYNPLDSSKRIHWKASAKTEKFLVKEFQRDQGKDLMIYFDCFPSVNSATEIQEKAISVVASLANKASEKGYEVTFCFPDKTFEIGDGERSITPLLDYLTELKPTAPQGKYRQPTSNDSMILQICSQSVTPILRLNHPHVRTAWIENFALQDRLKVT